MLKTKQQTTNVLDFFHSENRNVHVIHSTTTSFDEHPTRITSICARIGGTGEKRGFVPEHPPLSKNEILRAAAIGKLKRSTNMGGRLKDGVQV
jgi:hypothetical protein